MTAANDHHRDHRTALAASQLELEVARARFQESRRQGSGLDDASRRANLVTALENYAATIEEAGAPVPPQLKLEIRLHKGLRRGR